VSYESLAQGLKETLTLADVSAAGSYRFDLSASAGLSPKLRADGSVVFADAGGVVRFVLPSPTVQQAGQAVPSESHVAYKLSADGATLTVAVDPTWLAGAKFPVRVDPTVYPPEAAVACNLQDGSNANTSDCNSTTLKVGHSSSDGVRRGVVQFSDLSAVPVNAQVQWAN
jgi:hypothetical protein